MFRKACDWWSLEAELNDGKNIKFKLYMFKFGFRKFLTHDPYMVAVGQFFFFAALKILSEFMLPKMLYLGGTLSHLDK